MPGLNFGTQLKFDSEFNFRIKGADTIGPEKNFDGKKRGGKSYSEPFFKTNLMQKKNFEIFSIFGEKTRFEILWSEKKFFCFRQLYNRSIQYQIYSKYAF